MCYLIDFYFNNLIMMSDNIILEF